MELANNRKAFHDYTILDTYEAGIVLTGTEIKSLRNSGGNITDAYIIVRANELWLIAASIAPYKHGSTLSNHEERRERKLLMHSREIGRLKADTQEKGLTLIPLALYLKNGRVKVKVGLAKGKRQYDKREAIKKRETDKRLKQAMQQARKR